MGKINLFLVGIILLLSFILRFHNYTLYPQRGATSDEYTYPFLGVSLLTKHIPISWSAFSAYKNKSDLTLQGIYFPIVYPYFDHPPLYGLISGSFVLAFGQNTFEKIQLSTLRLLPLVMALVSSLLVFLLAQKLYSFKVAIWSLLIFCSSTVFVMNMRVGVAENFLTLVVLLALYLYVLWKKKITTKKVFILGLLCGAAFLTKVLGASVFFALGYLLLLKKYNGKVLALFTAAFLFCVTLFVVYGIYFDKNLFFQIQFTQSGRNISSLTFFYILTTPIVINKIILDGWYFFGFFSIFLLMTNVQKHKEIILFPLCYFILSIMSLTSQGQSGWYLIPFFPFLAIAAAYVLEESIQNASWMIFPFLFSVGFIILEQIYEIPFGVSTIIFRSIIIVLFAPLFIAYLFKKKLFFQFLAQMWFYFYIGITMLLTYYYIHPA